MQDAAVARGLDCIARFAQRLRCVPLDRVAVVGTAALRNARNRDTFLVPAARLLGHSIRILSGEEEAELIFLGVSHALAADQTNRLVIDIGGCSTEFCVGGSFAPKCSASVNVGCVTLTDRWLTNATSFANGYLDARRDACELLRPIAPVWKAHARTAIAIGTSGTVESVQSVLAANGFDSGAITRADVAQLERGIIERGWVTNLSVPGLAPERVDIFPAGLAALSATLEMLDIARIEFIDASLQHGLLYDVAARRTLENVQARTVEGWQRRFDVDRDQALRVRQLASRLIDDVSGRWDLNYASLRALLGWAADLHEIGLMVSARQPDRHGAYLIENGDLPGFTADERRSIALLIRSHRGGFPMFSFATFAASAALRLKRLAILLRLAVIFERTRMDADSPAVTANANDTTLDVSVDRLWLEGHALTRAELATERERLASAGVTLNVSCTG